MPTGEWKMDDSQSLLKVTSSVCAAPGNSTGWESALEEITRLVGAKAGIYQLINDESVEVRGIATCGYSAEDWARYEGMGGRATDARLRYLDNMKPGEVFRESETVRSQIKSIYRETGASCERGLVRLAAKLTRRLREIRSDVTGGSR